MSEPQLRDALADCHGLICLLTDAIDRPLLEAMPKLAFVSSISVGVDHIDVAALTERGVVGLLGVLLLVATVAMWAAPLVRRPLSGGFAAAVPRPAGLVAALLALGLISYYEEILHFRFLWALFGIVAVLGKDARAPRRV